MSKSRTVSRAAWLEARKRLLEAEKELVRQRDRVAAARRELPRVEVVKPYAFRGPDGDVSLEELFGAHSQLIVYHFMFGPGWEQGCPSCSFWTDSNVGAAVHLPHRDAKLVLVSRAPYEKLAAYQSRMGWSVPWYSSDDSDFNFDFGVSFTPEQTDSDGGDYNYRHTKVQEELPGLSVFARDPGGTIYHTYSTYARGLDMLIGTYNLLDLLPKGRDEGGLPWPMAWVRRHDQYDT